ncbi:hypothetical protein GFI45_08055 [Salmonella enterica subsp. enterica]|nr:hypothetical protein [Salmonella enterica subsp. enterica serovar Vitkin]
MVQAIFNYLYQLQPLPYKAYGEMVQVVQQKWRFSLQACAEVLLFCLISSLYGLRQQRRPALQRVTDHQPEESTQARRGGAIAARRIATNSRTAGNYGDIVCCNMLYFTTYKYYKPNQATIKQIAGGMVEMTIPCPPERETGVLSNNFCRVVVYRGNLYGWQNVAKKPRRSKMSLGTEANR